MIMLTRRIELQRKRETAAKRRASNDDIKIYNKVSSMKCNPFAGDTTVLDRTVDNRHDNLLQTEQDIINNILYPRHNFRVRSSDIKLVPDMVAEEIKDIWRAKIGQSRINGAKSLYKTDKLVSQDKV